MSYDIFGNPSDDSGSGGALDAIESIVGTAGGVASTFIAANSSNPGFIASGPLGTYGTGAPAIAAAKQPTSLLLIVVVAAVAIFAFSEAKKG